MKPKVTRKKGGGGDDHKTGALGGHAAGKQGKKPKEKK